MFLIQLRQVVNLQYFSLAYIYEQLQKTRKISTIKGTIFHTKTNVCGKLKVNILILSLPAFNNGVIC